MKKIIYAFVSLIVFTACEKDIDEIQFQKDARINFFNAANYTISYLIIDPEDSADFKYPGAGLFYTYNSNFPLGYSGSGQLGPGTIPYMALPAGTHQFFFADTARVIRAQKEVVAPPGTYTNLYITDSLLHYHLVAVESHPLQAHPNNVMARVINLSPDAVINTKLLQQDTITGRGLPQALPYKAVSEVFELHPDQALDGNFYFRFYHRDEETGEEIQVATVPAVPEEKGRMYTIVLQGYREEQRDIPINDDVSVDFPAGITATVRVSN